MDELIKALDALQRYDLENDVTGGSMCPDKYGDYVSFDDLVKALAKIGVGFKDGRFTSPE